MHPMDTTLHLDHARPMAVEPALHDHVRVPDGREGEVIGFYRRTCESVLVLFETGDSHEFSAPDVEVVGTAGI
jgi:hypothetical protein